MRIVTRHDCAVRASHLYVVDVGLADAVVVIVLVCRRLVYLAPVPVQSRDVQRSRSCMRVRFLLA